MKRVMDLVLVILGAPLWVPFLFLTWILVRLDFGAPAFFRQERAGLNGKPFTIVKFRTMRDLKDADGKLLPDEMRLTRTGRLLRSLSLDELPELLNVICGEMSLVGPRPLPTAYVERYSPAQARRLLVRPGLTGWAQVNGRNAIDWHTRFHFDTWYVDHRSILLDLWILIRTIGTVLRREGISSSGSATMTEFIGDPPDRYS